MAKGNEIWILINIVLSGLDGLFSGDRNSSYIRHNQGTRVKAIRKLCSILLRHPTLCEDCAKIAVVLAHLDETECFLSVSIAFCLSIGLMLLSLGKFTPGGEIEHLYFG